MAQGVSFKGQTKIMGKPSDMTDEECYGLPVEEKDVDLGTGRMAPSLQSVWELTDDEIKMITESKRIRLTIIGVGMPPVSISAEPKTEQ